MLKETKQYCHDFLKQHPVFGLWGPNQKEDACIKAAATINSECDQSNPSKCNACAISLA